MEHLGIISELDFYVFEKVCSTIKVWKDNGIEPVVISSNFSKLSMKKEDFVDQIVNIINKYDIDKKYVRIEFTESADIEDHEIFLDFLKKMNTLGISTSIDDFGIGFSSLSLITNPNVHNIKLDKSFVDDIVTSEDAAYLVGKIVDACRKLNKNLICEGVETREQCTVLKNMGCSMIQGYLFDRPLPEEQFLNRLENPGYTL